MICLKRAAIYSTFEVLEWVLHNAFDKKDAFDALPKILDVIVCNKQNCVYDVNYHEVKQL